MTTATESPEPLRLDEKKVGPCNFKRLPESGDYLVTNDIGHYVVLKEAEFRDFIAGRTAEGTPLHGELKSKGFLKEYLDFAAISEEWKKRYSYLMQGTGLHIIVVTLRCNQKCVYCQVSSVGMEGRETDMSPETAEKVVDRIFESPNREIMIEFQGGEPLANWPVVRAIIENAQKKNKTAKKELTLGLVSNLSLMDEEKLSFLLKHKVTFCTSLDGPAEIHERNRLWLGGTSHGEAVKWWQEIFKRTKGRRYRIDGLTTITRASLAHPKAIVDEYRRLGSRGIYLRPLTPLGFATKTWETIGYTPDEFLAFYRQAMDYIIELNLRNKKTRFFENMARQFLTKILLREEPNNLDVRSPCGAGIGQVAYNFDGSIYTCDEGRMYSRMGDESFRIGDVGSGDFTQNMRHPAVRSLITASVLDGQPQCSTCAYKPYDGVCPVYNYAAQGDIVGRMHSNARCHTHMGVLDYLFERIKDPQVKDVFERWVAKGGRPIRSDIFRRN